MIFRLGTQLYQEQPLNTQKTKNLNIQIVVGGGTPSTSKIGRRY